MDDDSFTIGRRGLCSGAPSGVDPVQPGEFRVKVCGNFAIAEFNTSRGYGGDFRSVRNEGDGPAFQTERAEQLQDHLAGVRVEVILELFRALSLEGRTIALVTH